MCDFIPKLLQPVAVLDLNVIGLLIGFLGGLLITFFGLPSVGVLVRGDIQQAPKLGRKPSPSNK